MNVLGGGGEASPLSSIVVTLFNIHMSCDELMFNCLTSYALFVIIYGLLNQHV